MTHSNLPVIFDYCKINCSSSNYSGVEEGGGGFKPHPLAALIPGFGIEKMGRDPGIRDPGIGIPN